MPIIRSRALLIHFAHIPKCAGTSVELYVRSIAPKRTAFLDRKFRAHDPETVWTKTSPQHVDGYSLSRLFPAAFFDLQNVTDEPLSVIEISGPSTPHYARKVGELKVGSLWAFGIKSKF